MVPSATKNVKKVFGESSRGHNFTMTSILYVRVGIFLKCGKYLHDLVISLRGEVWFHKTSLTPPYFIEVSVPSQVSKCV